MICIGIALHNSSNFIESPLLKMNIILEEMKKQIKETPYILFVDDGSLETETKATIQIIKEMIDLKYHDRLFYLKCEGNRGVFNSLNKMIKIITKKDIITSTSEIKAVIFKDHDDYITTANIESAMTIINDDVIGVPSIKIDVKESDLKDFKIMARKDLNLNSLKKSESAFINSFDVESLIYFGNGKETSFFEDDYKTACVKDVPNYYQEFYSLFNTYALAAYNTRLLDLLGGFDLYSLDSAGAKARDICALKVLNLLLKNVIKKSEEYFITTDRIKKLNEELLFLENIERKTRFSKLLFKPTIFRTVSSDSLSRESIENREFFYFIKLKQIINTRKSVYYELRNMKNAFMFLKSTDASEVINYFLIVIKHIIQSLYTPICDNNVSYKIIFKGKDWIFNKESINDKRKNL